MGELNLLIVDDEELLVESLARFFARKDFNVLTATRVAEAISLIHAHDIQIVITDMRMPDGLGTEVIKAARHKHQGAIIICATGFSEVDETTIIKGGADLVISKPFEKKALLSEILSRLAS